VAWFTTTEVAEDLVDHAYAVAERPARLAEAK
jgi:hypothetical protein